MKGYKEAFVRKIGDTMTGDLSIKTKDNGGYSSIRFKSDGEDKGSTFEWNGSADRRRMILYQFPSADASYAEAYQFPINTLDPSTVTDHQWYNIITTKNQYRLFPVGSCFITSTNTNPSTILGGGTWSLVDKQFKNMCSNLTAAFKINTTNVSAINSCYVFRDGHTVFVRLSLTNKVALTDSQLEMGTFQWESLGLSDGASLTNYSNWSYCDAINGTLAYTCSSSTGVLNNNDVIGNYSSSTGLTLYYNVYFPVTTSHMLDSACDKFIWKRTA